MELIPQVQKREIFDEAFELKSFFCKERDELCEYIEEFLEYSPNGVEIKFEEDSNLKDEEYILKLADSVTITSKGKKGAFRACTTLKQLAADDDLKKQTIHDWPDIAERGVMIDISRGKVPKIETLLNRVKILADLKYNQIQLYIDGPFFEFAHFEKYCKAFLTIDELKQLQSFCKKCYIDLVPNQNAFGHMEKWLAFPEFKPLGITREDGKNLDTLNPFDENSIKFVDTLFGDSLPYFESDKVNIGMDETWSLGMGQTKEACEKEGAGKVYVDYLNKIIDIANNKYNKTPMFWDDIALNHSDLLNLLNPNCIVMDWNYEAETPYTERARLLKDLGLRFYTCPGTSTWGSITGRFDNMIYNLENAARACIEFGGEGYLLTDWGDGGNPQFISASVMPYIFGACCSWNYVRKPKKTYQHVSYDKEVMIVKRCEAYADKFIFGQKGVARIVHKMANYYLLENQNRFNGTYTWADSEVWCYDKMPENEWSRPFMDKPTVRGVEKYMVDLKDELESLPAVSPYLEEIKCNCDMVILFARFIYSSIDKPAKKFRNDALKKDLENLKKEFVRLWSAKNHVTGSEIFTKRLDNMLNCIE